MAPPMVKGLWAGRKPSTLFQMRPAGSLTTLVRFDGANGADECGAMILATGGNFYGTTGQGGANGLGHDLSIDPGGWVYHFAQPR
jgi:hypothetical protein